MAWPIRSSRIAYDNPWLRVREDEVVRPDGSDGLYGVVEIHHPAVFVVAVSDEDEVVFVHVDRHTVGPSLEVPAGGSDGQDPLVAAQRELAEETGLRARTWTALGTMNALNGVSRAPEFVFLAEGLDPLDGGAGDPVAGAGAAADEGITEVRRIPWSDLPALVTSGGITDSETLASLMLAAARTGRIT